MPAVPVILTTQSALDYLQHQSFAFQPGALNTPTAWTSSALPPGLALNAGSGQISGAVTLPGVYVIALRASNADGVSEPVFFTFGIEASVQDAAANVIEVAIDLGTREVFFPPGPLFSAKRDDDLYFRVRFVKGGVANAVTLTELKVTLKELEPDQNIATSTAMSSLGGGVFLVYMKLKGDGVDAALSNHEGDAGTSFEALGEFTWLATHGLGIGPTSARGTSRTFRAEIVRDLLS